MSEVNPNIRWHPGIVSQDDRAALLGHRACVVWFTGLSASGKSTLAFALQEALHARGVLCYVLDGDNVRHGLNKNLGFSPEDRAENIRRVGEVSRLLYDAGVVVLSAFISPYREDRAAVRALVGSDFVEVFVDCTVSECARRDPKGLYAKAYSGALPEFTGVSAPYEVPERPEVHLHTDEDDVDSCVATLLGVLEKKYLVYRK